MATTEPCLSDVESLLTLLEKVKWGAAQSHLPRSAYEFYTWYFLAEQLKRAPDLLRWLVERVTRYGLCGLEEKPHELKPDACVGWLSYQQIEEMQARIEALEAERDLWEIQARRWNPQSNLAFKGFTPAEIAARVEQNRKKRATPPR